MTNYVLFDTEDIYKNLLPISFTRPVAAFRVGIDTLAEKWEYFLGHKCTVRPVAYLRDKFQKQPAAKDTHCLYIAGNTVADRRLADAVLSMKLGEALVDDKGIVAYKGSAEYLDRCEYVESRHIDGVRRLNYVYDIFRLNPEVIREDYRRITDGRKSQPLSQNNTVIGDYMDEDGMPLIFIEKGAQVDGAVLNTKDGPIYIGENAQIMEMAVLRGPISIGQNAKIRIGAKLYGGSTFGPYCKIGGEVDNTVIFGYSNKAHDGYLGNAVIGEWCNIGAGVNASNLKNDYSKIRIWNYASRSFMRTDLQFCGLIMGDHSKAGINCMFNTASVVGVGCNIHGCGFPRVFIPSFSEGSPAGGFSDVSLKKFYEIAERVMSRRNISLDETDRRIYERVFEVANGLKKKQ